MVVKIRKATERDFDVLLENMFNICIYESKLSPVKVANKKTRAFLKKNLKSWITSKKYIFLVAEIDGKIEGYILGWKEYISEAFRNSYVGYICDCYVSESYRGKSIGKKLVKAITLEFKKIGIKELKLTVLTNSVSVKIWEKLGFKNVYSEMRRLI